MESTRREQIKHTLLQAPYTLEAIKQIFQISIHTAYEDIQHIEKSCKKQYNLHIEPATCEKCDFIFQPKAKIPSRCPKCKSQYISPSTMQLLPK
ncbi:MAG: hypothetical protein KBC30_05260 [Planctomycetes bacterium]|jgi:predicted Zn-ribbon and HTH transcriptional regulator|nr:hypothetical protein [Planctomycetota bacterium]HON44262.1 hypothetical protein [Planctomycetota bacterium]HPY74390.1 hypothetical protein [Planctomycetota bacterium]HQA99950.1 hypothetical protein [Planctomycetota bacterium]HRU50881.1 hypothetical protein [Planctomycetota bacterium]